MGLEFEIALALGPFEIFTFFGNSGHFCASRYGAVLGSTKLPIAACVLSRKFKDHRIIIPGARATSGVTRRWHGATINNVYNSGTVIT